MIYTTQAKYDNLIIKDMFNESLLYQTYIESEIINESGFNAGLLLEANSKFSNKVKEIFKLLKEKIRNLWFTFTSKMEELFKENSKWLKDNKNRILTNKIPKGLKVEVIPYWIGDSELNKFNLLNIFPKLADSIDDIKNMDDKYEFRKKYFASYLKDNNKPEDLIDDIKDKLKGSSTSIEVDDVQIQSKIKQIYNYCASYDSEVKKLNQEYNYLNNKMNEIINKVNNTKVKEQQQENMYINVEECILSEVSLYDVKLLEAEVVSDNTKKETKDQIKKKVETKVGNTNTDNINSEDDKDELVKGYTLYVSEYYNMLSCKMTVMEAKYKEYMSLLRIIVKDTKVKGKK